LLQQIMFGLFSKAKASVGT